LNRRVLYTVIIIALVVETTGLVWLYLKYKDLNDKCKYATWNIATKSMRYLKSKIELLLYLSENNPDTHLMGLTARNAAEHSLIAARVLYALYANGVEKSENTYVLHVALSNMEVYFSSFANNPDSKRITLLRENKELLEEAIFILGEIVLTYQWNPDDVPYSLVSRLHEISEQLQTY